MNDVAPEVFDHGTNLSQSSLQRLRRRGEPVCAFSAGQSTAARGSAWRAQRYDYADALTNAKTAECRLERWGHLALLHCRHYLGHSSRSAGSGRASPQPQRLSGRNSKPDGWCAEVRRASATWLAPAVGLADMSTAAAAAT